MACDEFATAYEDDPLSSLAFKANMWIGLYLRLSYGEPRDHTILLCERRGELCGMVEISMQPRYSTPSPMPMPVWIKEYSKDLSPYLSNLLVDKNYRRRGIGKTLVKECEAVVRDKWESDTLSLHFDSEDLRLSRFYRRLGFNFQCKPMTRIPLPTTVIDNFKLVYAEKSVL